MQQIARSVFLALNNSPRSHRIILVFLIIFTLTFIVWRPYLFQLKGIQIRKITELDRNIIRSFLPESRKTINCIYPENENIQKKELNDNKHDNKFGIYKYVVSTGDTLIKILNHHGIDMSDITQLVSIDKELRNLKISQQLFWTLTNDGNLKSLTWEITRRKIRIYDRTKEGFKIRSELHHGDWVKSILKGTVIDNFMASAQAAGLTNGEISEVINALQWQTDFRKLKKGDEFVVMMYREILDGKREQSQLLGVRLHTADRDYYAIRANDGNFYDLNGIGVTKTFLRFPTSRQFRISSTFNPHRLNPITGRVSPHRGVDFVMPQGTPILSVGDGEVMVAKRSSAAGYYVSIRHGSAYTTRYMHLRKLLVHTGQKVKCGDRIALSGNTGRSTGPHLHYELWINHQAVNPMTVKLPYTEVLTGKNRMEYLIQVQETIPFLNFN